MNRHWLHLLGKRTLVFFHDILWIPIAITLAYWVGARLPLSEPVFPTPDFGTFLMVALPVYGFAYWVFGCYRGIWRFASLPDLVRIVKAVVLGTLVTDLLAAAWGSLATVPRITLVLTPLFLALGTGGGRLLYRALKEEWTRGETGRRKRTLIVGGGQASALLIHELLRHHEYAPMAVVDDKPELRGHEIHGVRILGRLEDLPVLLDQLDIETVLIAVRALPRDRLDWVVRSCASRKIPCRTIPTGVEFASGYTANLPLRPLTVTDLIGRDSVILAPGQVGDWVRGRRVLITGGGGSIGSELCLQIARHQPMLLAVVDQSEYNLYRIDRKLTREYPGLIFNVILENVTDRDRMEWVFEKIRPEIVFHAAAFKHVPLAEDNPVRVIWNNVFGTKIVADCAHAHGTSHFVFISTDKTVNPTNIMGTTKRLGELYCQALQPSGSTRFVIVRFGNVLSSEGSVVPLFEEQIAQGGPVTVTHPEVTRFFMTIPEAANLILQAGALGQQGDVFVLDMGSPIRIQDLAENMIRLSGFVPGREIQITHIGLRPGEKLHEELFYQDEQLRKSTHPKLFLAQGTAMNREVLERGLDRLREVLVTADQEEIVRMLKTLVPSYRPRHAEEGSGLPVHSPLP